MMPRKRIPVSFLSLALAASLHAGCSDDEPSGSGSSGTGGVAGSGGSGGAGGAGAGGKDSGSGGDAGASGGETGTDAGNATALLLGTYSVMGVTSDDRVIAVKLGGATSELTLVGKQTPITDDSSFTAVRGTSVFLGKSVATWVYAINVWSGGILYPLGSAGITRCDASADGNWVAFTDGTPAGGATTDVYFSKKDGSSKQQIAAGVQGMASPCLPTPVFTKPGQLLVGYCDGPAWGDGGAGDSGAADSGAPDGGSSGAWHLVRIDPALGVKTELGSEPAAGKHPFELDPPTEKQVLARNAAGGLVLHDLGSGSQLELAPSGVRDFAWLPDAKNVLIVTTTGELRRVSASSSPSPVVLATGIQEIERTWRRALDPTSKPAVSPDGKWVVLDGVADDLLLASTETAGTPVKLASSAELWDPTMGEAFTPDSALVVFNKNFVAPDGGPLWTKPVSGGAAAQVSSGNVIHHVFDAAGKLVFNDDSAPSGGFQMTDLTSLELGAKPQFIAKTGRYFWLDSTKTKVIFDVPQQGIYVAPLP